MGTWVAACISMARLREIGRLTSIRSRDPSRQTARRSGYQTVRTEHENEQAEHENEQAREPDVRVYANTQRGPIAGEIRFVHRTPPIPRSLTRTGSHVVYFLRAQLSRSPPRSREPLSWNTDSEFHDYIAQARRIMNWAYKLLRVAFAVFILGRRDLDLIDVIASPARLRRIVAQSIVQGLLVLQERTQRTIPTCLLCNRSPTPPRAPEPPPRNYIATDILEVRTRTCITTNGSLYYPITDEVSVLPPIPPRFELRGRPMYRLCGRHRYEFQFLVYQVISPSWPVPYLQEDMAMYGEVVVGRFAVSTRFDEPRR